MTREQAINYLISSGFSEEQVSEVVRALTYQPTTKNDLGVDCISRDVVKNYIQAHIHEIITESGEDKNKHTNRVLRSMIHGVDCMPSVTPQLSVPEVTALAEWVEKLTKASEDAYNKGYADGVKSVNICPHCGEYIGEEE